MDSTAAGIRSVIHDATPDLGLHDAVASVRIGTRAGHRLARLSFASPAITAGVCWFAFRALRAVGLAWTPFPTPIVAWWFYAAANFFTLCALIAIATALISPTPTHRVVHGRLQPTRREPWKSTGPGFARIKAAKEHLTREERRARRDIDKATRRLGRMGAKRRRAWERQWAAEDQVGAGRSKPGSIDAFLMRRAPKPKAKAVRPKGAKKPKGKQHRKRLDAEFDAEVARIAAARADVLVPRLDPDAGPPLAPLPVGEARTEDPMVTRWNEHAAVVQAETHRYLAELQHDEHERNGWAGYTPPPAPISVRDDQ